MPWIFLLLASICEIAFAACLKLTENFSNLKWTIAFIFFYVLSIILLNKAVQHIPVGTAYAVWTGIGAAGTIVIGMMAFGEPTDLFRVARLILIVAGMVGLKLASP